MGWIGREIAIGEAILKIEARITRLLGDQRSTRKAGVSDADTLKALEGNFGHQDFGSMGGDSGQAGSRW